MGAKQLANGDVADAVAAPDRHKARGGNFRKQLLIGRPLDAPLSNLSRDRRGRSVRAGKAAETLADTRRAELTAADSATRRRALVATAMGLQCRRAVGADDAQVLEPVVVGRAVDVVEDQRH